MSRSFLGLIAGVGLLSCAALAPSAALARGACPDENTPVAIGAPAALRASVLCLVNETRLRGGLAALRRDARLESAAQAHTDDMVARHFLAHNNPEGTDPGRRMTAAGYPLEQAGENIAQGALTPAVTVDLWMTSPAHCVNVFEPAFRDVGVGVSTGAADPAADPGTWTQDFGRLQGVPAPSADTTAQASCGSAGLAAVDAGPTPTTATAAATNIGPSGATLNGTVGSGGGGFTSYHLDWGTTTAYGSQTLERGAGAQAAAVAEPVTGLTPSTTYHYRLVAMNQNGEVTGPDASFTTSAPPLPPIVTLAASGAVARTTARVRGTVNPNGRATAYRFEYGLTSSYSSATAITSAGAGASVVDVSADLGPLAPSTTYHYRLVAASADGITATADAILSTLAAQAGAGASAAPAQAGAPSHIQVATAPPTATAAAAAVAKAAARCVVPSLRRRTLAGARKALARAHCALGKVTRRRHGRHRHTLRVATQNPAAGLIRRPGFAVGVRLS